MPAYSQLKECFDDGPLFRSKLEMLRELWDSKRRQLKLPSRADFPARSLKPWLPHMAVVEAVGQPVRFKVRLMGMACVRIAGADNTGKYIDECVTHKCLPALIQSYTQCLAEQMPVVRKTTYVRDNVMRTTVHRLFLPCLGDSGLCDTVMVAVYAVEELGQFYDLEAAIAKQKKKLVVDEPQTVYLV